MFTSGYTNPQYTVTSRSRPILQVYPLTKATTPFISSPLGFVPKPDGSWCRIYHLSYPAGKLTNDGILIIARAIEYITLENIFNMVVRAGWGCILIKKDIKDAFRNIPVTEED